MTSLLRFTLALVAWTVALSAAAAVAAGVLIARAVRAARLEAQRASWARREHAAAQVRELADRDVLGQCGWCGAAGHAEHPARVHADEVAVRVRERVAAAA